MPNQFSPPTNDGSLQSGSVDQICHDLHIWLNSLPKLKYPFDEVQIPGNGIYVLFEDGEFGHGTARIVRIGTDTGNDQLRSRLNQHFVKENKDRSIFRKNIGRCLLNRDNDPFLADWNLDLTTRKAKDAHAGRIDSVKQKEVESRVSKYLRNHFTVAVFEVAEKGRRLELESKLIDRFAVRGVRSIDDMVGRAFAQCQNSRKRLVVGERIVQDAAFR